MLVFRESAFLNKNRQNAKTVFGHETYLEKRLGIVKHGLLLGFLMRIFLKFFPQMTFGPKFTFGQKSDFFSQKVTFSQTSFASWGLYQGFVRNISYNLLK